MQHPNIVSVHEVGRDNGRIYIASDFIEGTTLEEWVRAHSLTIRKSVELCTPIAEALHHSHEAGVAHRDFKPQNILVSHYPARSAPIHGGKDHRPDESGHYERADYISEPFGLPVVEPQCYRSLLCNHGLNLWQSLHLGSEFK